MTYYTKVERLSIEFPKGIYDWIVFRLYLGDRSIQTRFWAYADPLPSFKRWLEAICVGVQNCSFSFDAEGDDLRFELDRRWKEVLFRVKYAYGDDPKVLLEGLVDPGQLVREFYHGFLKYRSSPQFNSDGWEVEYRWERLTRDLKLSRRGLEQKLLTLSRSDMEVALFGAETPGRFDEVDGLPQFDSTGNLDELFELELFPRCPAIPFDYDERSLAYKENLIAECLNQPANECNGSKLLNLRSEMIDNFLAAAPNIGSPNAEPATNSNEESWPEILLRRSIRE